MRMVKKNYPQVYLKECKYKIKKIQMSAFINTELESDSESDTDDDNDSDNDSLLILIMILILILILIMILINKSNGYK